MKQFGIAAFALAFALVTAVSVSAGDAPAADTGVDAVVEAITLPPPAKTGGMPLTEALAARQTGREYADAEPTPQQLSDLLWATAGVNRKDSGKKVYPVARGRQDMTVYVITKTGAFRYDAATHALARVPGVDGDRRADAGAQGFVARAAVNLVFVQDMDLWNADDKDREMGAYYGLMHTGALMQNAGLWAASQGWSSVARGMFDEAKLRALLKLAPNQKIRLTHSVGPAQKDNAQ